MNSTEKTYATSRLNDPKWYLEHFCSIKTKSQGLQPFILNEMQKDLFNTMSEHDRIILLKSRQLGSSTGVIGYFYHDTITTPAINTAFIAYNTDLAMEFLDKVKTFIRSTPPEVQPTVKYDSKYEISFSKMDSKIIILPSTEKLGRGYTLKNVLASELAFWEKAEEKIYALEASIPVDGGKMVIESTPGNIGDLYHEIWTTKNNGYVKKEYGYWWLYSEEEIEKIRMRMNNPMKFAQEYGLDFMSSGRPVFDLVAVKQARRNILNVGDKNGDFVVREEDGWIIYKDPEPGGLYCSGVDVSEGVQGGDYSVITIFDRSNGEEVAFWRGHIPPDLLAQKKIDPMGRRYNNAYTVVEVNNHGLTTLTVLKQLLYPGLYFRPQKYETMGQGMSEKMGWRTTRVTRPILIDEFAEALRDKDLIIHSEDTLGECLTFVYDAAANMQPVSSKYHDDCIFSVALALQGFKMMPSEVPTQIDISNMTFLNYGAGY
jgi:hypothetical protein